MNAPRRRRQSGLTLLEFTLFAIIMSALVAFALDRIAAVRVYMERAAVEYSVARMREVLALHFAERVTAGRLEELTALVGINPLAVSDIVDDYRGVRHLPPAGEREPGQWYFDAAIGNVVYVPRYPEALVWPDGEPRILRWRARPDWEDIDDDGEFDRRIDRIGGMELERLDGAHWR